MSGGHYNYAYLTIRTLVEDIRGDIDSHEEDNEVLSDNVKTAMHKLATELESMANKVKALEWFMSGDSGENRFLAEMKS